MKFLDRLLSRRVACGNAQLGDPCPYDASLKLRESTLYIDAAGERQLTLTYTEQA